jgi:hypothetical protein
LSGKALSIVRKYQTTTEVVCIDKHTCLQWRSFNYRCKKFCNAWPQDWLILKKLLSICWSRILLIISKNQIENFGFSCFIFKGHLHARFQNADAAKCCQSELLTGCYRGTLALKGVISVTLLTPKNTPIPTKMVMGNTCQGRHHDIQHNDTQLNDT